MSAPKLSLYYSDRSDDGRAYRAPQELGLPDAPSVTTVLKLESKDNLVQWAADMTALRAAESVDSLLTRSVRDGANSLRYWHTNFRDDRAAIGTAVHEYIESDLNESWTMPEVWDREVAECIEQYHLFRSAHVIEPYFVETTLWSEKYNYAGTADFIGDIDGVLWSLDVKSSRNLWPGHEYQISALENCDFALVEVPEDTDGALKYVNPKKEISWWAKMPLPKIEKRGFLHLRPDEWHPMTGKFTPAYWELVEVPGDDIEPLFKTFMGYRSAWDGIAELKRSRALREKAATASIANEQKEVA